MNVDWLGESIPSTNKYYPGKLRQLLVKTKELDNRTITIRQANLLAGEYMSLVKWRKDYSDSLYEAEMKRFFTNESIKIVDKVRYMDPIAEAK